MAEARRLRGHTKTATCCIASRDKPGLVVTAAEDGNVCWFDMRCKDVQLIMDVSDQPVTSLCFNPGNEDIIYVSSGKEIKCYDVHLGTSWKPLHCFDYNKEEINQVVCNSKSSFLASADDGGEVKIIDTRQQCLYKTLRSGHTSICSTVQFLPWRSWEVISGGLDSKLMMWDFSKGRPHKIMDFGLPETKSSASATRCLNPAFVHAVAVPDAEMLDMTDNISVVGRGDGIVDIINIESELAAFRSKGFSKPKKGSLSQPKGSSSTADLKNSDQNVTRRMHLDYTLGGHTAAVSCVTFSLFNEKGKFIISGGNDRSVKVWDWTKYSSAGQSRSSNDLLKLNLDLQKKVNWLCTTPNESENLIVCDTSKVVKVYSIS